MGTSKRRSAAQIAADAQATYRASVAKRHATARETARKYEERAQKAHDDAQAAMSSADAYLAQATALAAELARIDAAAAALTVTP